MFTNQKRLIFFICCSLLISCTTVSHCVESSIYEFYTGYTHLRYFLVLDKIDKTFTFCSDNYAICGYYKTSANNDTLFFSRNCIIGSLEVKAKDTCCVGTSVFIRRDNYLEDISVDYFHLSVDNHKELLPSCPSKLYKVKVSEIKQEKEYLRYWPGPVR